jgi:hypothetical protein
MNVQAIYRVIKKSLCTWRLQYNHQLHRDVLITLYHRRGLRIGGSSKPLHGLPCHLLQLVARGLYSATSELPSCLIPRVLQLLQRKLKLGWACNEKLQRRGTVTSAPEGMRVQTIRWRQVLVASCCAYCLNRTDEHVLLSLSQWASISNLLNTKHSATKLQNCKKKRVFNP